MTVCVCVYGSTSHGLTAETTAYLTMRAAWQLLTFKTSVRNPPLNNTTLCLGPFKTGILKSLCVMGKNHCYVFISVVCYMSGDHKIQDLLYIRPEKKWSEYSVWPRREIIFWNNSTPGQTSHLTTQINSINEKGWSSSYCMLSCLFSYRARVALPCRDKICLGWCCLCE